MGTIYKRGKVWWIQYYQNGKPYRESSKSRKKTVARKKLEIREGEIARGKLPGIQFDKVTFDELAADFLTDYELNQRKSQERAQICVDHLKQFFEGMRVVDLSTARIKAYIKTRLAEEAANATVNRELAALKRMLYLGAKDTPPRVDRVPYIPILEENNTRKGFFEHDSYLSILKALPSYLRGPVTFGYVTAWRKSEILGLTWDHVDLREGAVRLETGETKNNDARTIYLDEELNKLFRIQNLRRVKGCPYVFHRDGQKIKDIRGAWDAACTSAGLTGRLFHDLRRTAVRNMVRAGIPEGVAMRISGHRTRTVFERYIIVSPEDLKKAAVKHEAYRTEKFGTATKTATIGNQQEEIGNVVKLEVVN